MRAGTQIKPIPLTRDCVFYFSLRLKASFRRAQNKKPIGYTDGFSLVEIPVTKNNQLNENVGLKDTKNEKTEVRNESETPRHRFPDFFAVPDFKLPEANPNMSKPALWNELNMDALGLWAAFSYLVSIGKICPKTGRLINPE